MRILFAEDERDLNRIVTKKLTEDGYSVDPVFEGSAALLYLRSAESDGAILDVMMPGLDGFEVLKRAREQGIDVPVLFLTARDSVEDKVRGLDAGACDYMIKPFSMAELSARVRALVRRPRTAETGVLTAGELRLDLASQTLTRRGEPVLLSAKEFALLEWFMKNRGRVLSRENIEEHVWNFDYEGGTNVVDVYVSYLRRKLGPDGALLRTVRGSGYVFDR